MLEFQEKRKFKKLIYCRVTSIILLIIALLILKGVWGVYKKQNYTRDNLERVAKDLKNLKDREQMLSSEILWLKTENGKEEEIREKYGLVRPGEEVINIVEPDRSDADSHLATRGFWQKMLDWLK